MSATTYTRYELLRTLRNRRFFIFSLGFPVILFLVIAGPNRGQKLDGIPFALYYMTGMITFGTMTAVMAGGGRIALEREVGWNRQLRITPLTSRAYFEAKLLTGYLMALISIALLGGAWGPVAGHGVLRTVAGLLPSYWLMQAGKSAFGSAGWPAEAWIVTGVWTAVLVRLAVLAYRRDTGRA